VNADFARGDLQNDTAQSQPTVTTMKDVRGRFPFKHHSVILNEDEQ